MSNPIASVTQCICKTRVLSITADQDLPRSYKLLNYCICTLAELPVVSEKNIFQNPYVAKFDRERPFAIKQNLLKTQFDQRICNISLCSLKTKGHLKHDEF